MGESTIGTYTAMLTDGPLEGKTVTTEFLDGGDPRPRLELQAGSPGKRYLYGRRGGGVEYASDDTSSERPSAVEYSYLETLFD